MSRWALGFAGILGCLLLAPAFAVADQHRYIVDGEHSTHIEMRGSNGYRVHLYTGDRHRVWLEVRKGGVTTEYGVRGSRHGRYGINANFRGLGQVRVRFIPNGRQRRVAPPSWCEGPAGFVLEGRVEGRIQFVGEQGYTSVSVRRARAEVETWPRMRCRVESGGQQTREWAATFNAFGESAPSVLFSIKRYSEGLRPAARQVVYSVYTGSLEQGVSIYRSARVLADNSTFVVPDAESAPENILFRPPPPFSGSASLQRTSESVFRWEGDLSIQFPGVEPFPLTGPRFETRYCAQRGCVTQEASDEPA